MAILPKSDVILTAAYLAAGTLIFVFAEPYVAAWIGDRRMPMRSEREATDFAAKGVTFVLASGLVLYLVLRRAHLSRRAPASFSQVQSERLALIAKATTDGMWDLDLRQNHLWRSEGYGRQFGYESSELESSLEGWMQHLHPDDQDRVVSELREAIRTGQEHWTAEYRFRRKDGSFAVVVDRALVLRDEQGQPVRIIGGMTEVTARREAG